MAQISASMVKELREKTGAGMMDAKKALVETDGDIEGAVDWLRQKGLAKAAKKSGRTAAEGLVAVAISEDEKRGIALEVNAETDFVARNAQFQEFVKSLTELSLEKGITDADTLKNTQMENGKSVADTLTELIATIGENMTIRRLAALEVQNGFIAKYIHNAEAENMGKIGVMAAFESTGDVNAVRETGRKIAMHIAAVKPEFLNRDDVTGEALEREKNILREQAKDSGKPAEIIEKMIEGRLRKYYEEVCLLEQTFVIDGESKISQVVEQMGKDAGAEIRLTGYENIILGAGIEVEEENFADEVARTVNG